MNKKQDLTSGSVFGRLVGFALPFLFANFMQTLYAAVDMWTVGHFSKNSSDLTAVNVGAQVVLIITGTIIGLAMGTTVSIGHAVGAKDSKKASEAVGSSVRIFVKIALFLTPLMILLAKPLALLMQTPVEACDAAALYIMICGGGIPFIIAYNVISAMMRGDGNSTMPMVFVGIACVINIAGDLLLSGVCGMGVMGVAIATVTAQTVASLTGLFYLRKKGMSFPVKREHLRRNKVMSKKIISIGLPIAVQNGLINVSFIAITVIANTRGVVDASGVAVVEKLIDLMFLFPTAMTPALAAITSQNIGAGKPERAVKSVKYGFLLTLGFGLLCWGAAQIIPRGMCALFTDDPAVIAAGSKYLVTYTLDCFLVAFVFPANGYLCGIGKSMVVFVHNTITSLAIRIPFAVLFSNLFPDTMLPMGIASPIGSVLSTIILVSYLLWLHKQHKKREVVL